jgi:hypothetical protein
MADRDCATVRTCPPEPAERYGFQCRSSTYGSAMSASCERVKVVPVDGTVMRSEAVIDMSPLGGEPLPQTASRAIADRYAGFFLPAAVLVAGLAWV